MPVKKKTAVKAAPVKKTVAKKAVKPAVAEVDISALRPFGNYGIARVDQPAKSNHGYYVRVNGNSVWFSDKRFGSNKKALAAAKEKRDELFDGLSDRMKIRASRKHKPYPKRG
jgi:hypothetical protein